MTSDGRHSLGRINIASLTHINLSLLVIQLYSFSSPLVPPLLLYHTRSPTHTISLVLFLPYRYLTTFSHGLNPEIPRFIPWALDREPTRAVPVTWEKIE